MIASRAAVTVLVLYLSIATSPSSAAKCPAPHSLLDDALGIVKDFSDSSLLGFNDKKACKSSTACAATPQRFCEWIFDAGVVDAPAPQILEIGLRFIDWKYNRTFNVHNLRELEVLHTFDCYKPIVILATKWWDAAETLARAYKCTDFNFFVFDTKHYMRTHRQFVLKNAEVLGDLLGKLLYEMRVRAMTESPLIHFIGFGVGTLIAGPMATAYTSARGSKVGRVTLLNPVFQCLSKEESHLILNKNMASLVDVIHTDNGGTEANGHVDFYPNGRVALQPGTRDMFSSSFRAFQLYAESVIPGNTFPARMCPNVANICERSCVGATNQMGQGADKTRPGVYFLKTECQPPFRHGNALSCN